MSRSNSLSLFATLVVVLLGAPTAALAQSTPIATLESAVAPPATAVVDEALAEDELEMEEEWDEEVEFCGGGEMSLVDELFEQAEWGDRGEAYDGLVAALRDGAIEDWERGRALVLLADLQLSRGEPGRALVNFGRAERLDPGVTDERRADIAAALLLRGRTRSAREEAREVHEEVCADRYASAACYEANLVLSRVEPGAAEREQAREAAAALRAELPDYAEMFDRIDARVAGS